MSLADQIAELRHKDEIDRAVAKHLIRDRNIATPRVRDRRDLHGRSLTPREAWGNESGRFRISSQFKTDSVRLAGWEMLHACICASEPASGSLSVLTQPAHRKRSIQSPVPIGKALGL